MFTPVWALYFFVKAGFYVTVALLMPLTQAIWLAAPVMALMVAVSITQGRRLFRLCHLMGLLPLVPAQQ